MAYFVLSVFVFVQTYAVGMNQITDGQGKIWSHLFHMSSPQEEIFEPINVVANLWNYTVPHRGPERLFPIRLNSVIWKTRWNVS